MRVKFRCECGKKIAVTEQFTGNAGKCPKCGATISLSEVLGHERKICEKCHQPIPFGFHSCPDCIPQEEIPNDTSSTTRQRGWVVYLSLATFIHIIILLIFAALVFNIATVREAETFFNVSIVDIEKGRKAKVQSQSLEKLPNLNQKEIKLKAVPTLLDNIPNFKEPQEEIKRAEIESEQRVKLEMPKDVIGLEGGVYSRRFGRAKSVALTKSGGSAKSENAVRLGLEWLAQHQDSSGKWDCDNFTKHCGEKSVCGGAGGADHDVAVTGLALLAFLGAGNTYAEGKFKDNVKRGLNYLREIQKSNGCFGKEYSRHMYGQGIATLAAAEAYAMTSSLHHDIGRQGKFLRRMAQLGINFIVKAQQKGGGWNYTTRPSWRNDTSVTGWQVMALRSAISGKLKVPLTTIYGAIEHFEKATRPDGFVAYLSVSTRTDPAMTAVGMFCQQILGMDRDDPMLKKQANILIKILPDWQSVGSDNNMYYWYYGTLAMFQMGGRYWKTWNLHLRDMLIEHQRKSGHAKGSWDPIGAWGHSGGRIYSTALCTLDLEVYYRYLPLYKIRGGCLIPLMVKSLRSTDSDERLATLHRLLKRRGKAPQVLVRAFAESDQRERLRIIQSLSQLRQAGENVTPLLAAALKMDRYPVVLALANALKADDLSLSSTALDFIIELGERASPSVSAAFRDCSEEQKLRIVRSLIEKGDAAAPALEAVLQDANAQVRLEAAKGLAKFDQSSCISTLQQLLKYHNPNIRLDVINTATKMKKESAVPILIEALADPNPALAKAAIENLKMFIGHGIISNSPLSDFDPQSPIEKRREAVGKWREWWKNMKRTH